jgi:hypothetical protein
MHGLESVLYQSSPMAASNQYRKMQTRPSLDGAVRSENGYKNHQKKTLTTSAGRFAPLIDLVEILWKIAHF